jgi:tripartite-type tricarboxylate transporter receptor subunit TctC
MHYARGLIVLAAAFALASPATAQDWPAKPIRVIVPYAPGGTDQQIRAMAPTLQKILGQPLVIENKAGAGAALGAAFVKDSAPDGYTVLYTGNGALTVVTNMRKQSYSLDDFVAIGNVTGTPFVVAAKPGAPFKTIQEMVAFAKANPDKVTYGSAGAGTTTHMAGEAIAAAAGIKIVHVPYQGIGPAVASILGGNVDMVIGLPSAIMPHVAGGRLVALASTGPAQIELLKGIPTLKESGIDVIDVTKFGMLAPKGTPPAVTQKLAAALREATASPEFADLMRKSYNSIMYMEPEQFRSTLQTEDRYFKGLIDRLGLAEKS